MWASWLHRGQPLRWQLWPSHKPGRCYRWSSSPRCGRTACPGEATVEVRFASGPRATGTVWSELIELGGAEALALFSGGVVDGRPAITRNSFGGGEATYLGTRIEPPAMARLLGAACARAGVRAVADMPDGIEAVRRQVRGRSFLFLLNHRDAAVDVPVAQAGTNLVDGAQVHPGLIRLLPRGVAVLKEGW